MRLYAACAALARPSVLANFLATRMLYFSDVRSHRCSSLPREAISLRRLTASATCHLLESLCLGGHVYILLFLRS